MFLVQILILLGQSPILASRNFQLAKDSPSFAIHGDRLQNFSSIGVSAKEIADFLIDVTQTDCQELPTRKSKSLTKNEPVCTDPIPFTINGISPTATFDEEILYSSSPGNTQIGHFYASSFKIENETLLTVRPNEKVKSNYAISFRVRQWVNETQKILVLPGTTRHLIYEVLIKSGVTATIVPNPKTYFSSENLRGPLTKQTPVDHQIESKTCSFFQSNITCSTQKLYQIYAGSDPGIAKNPKHLLIETESGTSIDSRNSASSVFTRNQCNFCLIYNTNIPALSLDVFSLWTPFWYPWFFDLPDKSMFSPQNDKQVYYEYAAEFKPFIGELKQLSGGEVIVYGTKAACDTTTFKFSYTSVPFYPKIPFQAQCIRFLFCPFVNGRRTMQLYLDEKSPSFAIHGFRLAMFETITMTPVNCTFCKWIIDYTQANCIDSGSSTEPGNCFDPIPFLINGEEPGLPNIFELKPRTESDSFYMVTTKLNMTHKIVLSSKANVVSYDFAVSLRIEEWQNDTKKKVVIPGTGNNQASFFVAVQRDEILTIVINQTNDNGPITKLLVFPITDPERVPASCRIITQEEKCSNEELFPVYFGSALGASFEKRYHLIDAILNQQVLSKTTATTIFVEKQCSFCLLYQPDIAHYGLDDWAMWTPSFYPWKHDQIDYVIQNFDWRSSFEKTVPSWSSQNATIEIVMIETGSVRVLGLEGKDCNGLVYRKSFIKPVKFSLKTACVELVWRPELNGQPVENVGLAMFFTLGAIILFTQSIIAVDISLTSKSPSYAVHGRRLLEFKKITISIDDNNVANREILIDYTQVGCKNTRNSSLENHKISIDVYKTCLDEFPFTVNGEILDSKNGEVMPYNEDMQELLYSTTFTYKTSNSMSLLVNYTADVYPLDFGLSFRVKNWVNATKKIWVLPAVNETKRQNFVLVKLDVIVTAVIYPPYNLPTLELNSVLQPNDKEMDEKSPCQHFKVDVTCPKGSLYSVFFGSDPGLNPDPRYHIGDYKSNISIVTKTTATSVQAASSCLFCLTYQANKGVASADDVQFLDNFALFSSPFYPWIHDEPYQSGNHSYDYGMTTFKENREHIVLISVKSIDGIKLEIGALGNDKQVCTRNHGQWHYFDAVPTFEIKTLISCLIIGEYWAKTEPPHGFVFSIQENDEVFPADNANCLVTYELTIDEPHMIFRDIVIHENQPLCIHRECDDRNCEIFVDLAFQCPQEEADCSTTIPLELFQVDRNVKEWEECEEWPSKIDKTTLFTCHLVVDELAFFAEFNHPKTWAYSAIVRRNADLNIYVFPTYNNLGSRPYYESTLGYEVKSRATPTDADRFEPQFLDSSCYSVLVPAGCSPTIYLKTLPHITTATVFNRTKLLCDGRIFLTSMGYGNPSEGLFFPYYWQKQYTFSHHIFCDGKINIEIEVFKIGSGNLTLEILDTIHGSNDTPIVLLPGTKIPANFTIANKTGLNVFWNALDEDEKDPEDEQTPSFAIHGSRLNIFTTYTIIGVPGVDWLIDYTQDGCKTTKNDHPREPNTPKIRCFDQIPFEISGKSPEKQEQEKITPYSENLRIFYSSTFKLANLSQLVIKPTSNMNK
ncbi:unnamed protein product, partial [Mesorhabditis belari]|uniref:Uncharacterized protein n=1 Tax=Mesorhabditis belari TaxID=2138241 RepID=A0AAF3F9B4_9BILA